MQIVLMKGKIHCASVTESDLHFEGSISIDRALLDAAGILINERSNSTTSRRGHALQRL